MSDQKNLPKEIERKFLLKNPLTPELIENWGEKERIVQGYLSKDEDKVVRIRLTSDPHNIYRNAYLTVKGRSNGSGMTRVEIETQLEHAAAKVLLENFCGKVIDKTRYKLRVCGNIWEIDQFHGDNEGLWVVEIELESEDQEFVKPSFVGEEVTHDPKYTNVRLAEHPFKDW